MTYFIPLSLALLLLLARRLSNVHKQGISALNVTLLLSWGIAAGVLQGNGSNWAYSVVVVLSSLWFVAMGWDLIGLAGLLAAKAVGPKEREINLPTRIVRISTFLTIACALAWFRIRH